MLLLCFVGLRGWEPGMRTLHGLRMWWLPDRTNDVASSCFVCSVPSDIQ